MHTSPRSSTLSWQSFLSKPTPDATFFYEPLYIQVANCLFCVPKKHLNVSGSVFSQMFIDGTPSNVANVAEGSHRSNPIVLEGIDPKQFRSFLKGAWRRNDVEIPIEDWINILDLAHQWNFKKVCSFSGSESVPLLRSQLNDTLWKRDPFHFIDLGRQFLIREWIIRGYEVLVDPGYSLGGRHLINKGLRQDQMIKLLMIKDEVHQYWRNEENPCFSCRDTPPFEDRIRYVGGSQASSGIRVFPQAVAYCSCGATVFADQECFDNWHEAADALIRFVFEDELKDYHDEL